MTLPVKAGIGLATIGTIGGVGYGIVAYSKEQGTEISKLVEAEYRYILLDTSAGKDENHWTTNWDSYKKANENSDKDFFGLKGWTKGTQTDLKDKLKEKCKELSKSKIKSTEDKLFERVTTYCGRHVSIKDQAKKENLKVIKVENNDTAWTKVEGNKENIKSHFPNLGIVATSGTDITKQNIIDGCKKALDKNKSDAEYDKAYASYKVVCASE